MRWRKEDADDYCWVRVRMSALTPKDEVAWDEKSEIFGWR
jgi:hypothetical protein